MKNELEVSGDIVLDRCGFVPEIAMILGSGLGALAEEVESPVRIPYSGLPGMPESTAPGHVSELVAGSLSGKKVLILRGRFHYYEGYGLEQIVSPVRLLEYLGCPRLLLTNAAGAVNRSLSPGDLMLITDHVNLTGKDPLRGKNDDELGRRFPDMSRCWASEMRNCMKRAAFQVGLNLKEGIYLWLTGPSFETPAEIRMARTLGADAVGMSTVPEAVTASYCGLRTVGVSYISNMAAGILDRPITAAEVMETGRSVRVGLSLLIQEFLKDWG